MAATYLPQSSLAICQSRSATQCSALNCDGILTKYWWSCQVFANAVSGNTAALVIQPGTPFDVTTTNQVAHSPTGLSPTEQLGVQTEAQLGTALPWIITTLTFDGRLTSGQKTSIQSQFSAEWTAIQGAAVVNLQSATVLQDLSDWLSAGIISQTDYQAITAQQATIASP